MLDPARTARRFALAMRFATGTSRLFFRPAWRTNASLIDASRQQSASMGACPAMWRRCCSCASARLRITAAWILKLPCTAAHAVEIPGCARIRSMIVLKMTTVGRNCFFLCNNHNTTAGKWPQTAVWARVLSKLCLEGSHPTLETGMGPNGQKIKAVV